MKVIVSAGGTGGHIYPALSVIETLKKDKKCEILYIGTNDRMESKIVPEKGIKFIGLDIYGLSKNIITDIKNVHLIFSSYQKCKKIIKEFKPDYVIGFGGYVTFPVLLAASKLKIRCGIHEQNMIPGKTNKFLSKKVETTFISFEESKKYFNNNVIYSGNPVNEIASEREAHDKTTLGFSKDKKLIIIVMGSLGSTSVNDKLKDFLMNYDSKTHEILFITGKGSYNKYKDLKVPKSIKIVPYYDDLSGLMKVADIIISRAGASTISEILSLDLPSILVPSPYVANNHQYYNALDLKEKNLAIMLEEKDLNSENLRKSIKECIKNYDVIKDNLKKEKKLKSSTIIVEEMKK